MDSPLTRDELSSIAKALENQEFRNLLVEYAEELKDPENRKRYEEEITQFERQRGRQVEFIHPDPGFCLKCGPHDSPAYVNVCSSKNLQKPSTRKEKGGATWSIPHSLFQPKEGLTGNNKKTTVFDVVFHPDAISLSRNPVFKRLAVEVAVEAINKSFGMSLDHKSARVLKIPYKGTPTASMVCKEGPVAGPPTIDQILPETPPKPLPTDPPQYFIKYRSTVQISDYDNLSSTPDRPRELVLTVKLPGVARAEEVDFEVFERHAVLTAPAPLNYNLEIPFKHLVDQGNSTAIFDKTARTLSVTLPIIYNDPPPEEARETPAASDRTPDEPSECLEERLESLSISEIFDWSTSLLAPFDCRVEDNILHVLVKVPWISRERLWVGEEGNCLSLKCVSIGEGGFPLNYCLFLRLEWVSSLTHSLDLTPESLLITIGVTPREGSNKVITYGIDSARLSERCSPPSFDSLGLPPDDIPPPKVGSSPSDALVPSILRVRSQSEIEESPFHREKRVSFCSSTKRVVFDSKSLVSDLFVSSKSKTPRRQRRRASSECGGMPNVQKNPLNDVGKSRPATSPVYDLMTSSIVFEIDSD